MYSKTIGYYAAFVAFGLISAALGPSLPNLAEKTHTDLSQISLLFTAHSLGFLLGVFLGGQIFDNVPGHPSMTVALVGLATVAALIPLVPLLWLLAFLLLIAGISIGIIEVGGNTLLVWIHRYNIGPWMNGLHFFFGAGAFLSPMIITHVINVTGDIKWGFWIFTMIILFPAGWLLCLPSPSIQGTFEDDQENHFNYLLVIPISVIFLLYVGAEISFGGWIYTYTVTVHPGLGATAGYLTAGFWGALTVGRLLAIPVSMHFTPRAILLINFIGCLVSISVILKWSNLIVAVWAGTLGTGISMASIFPTLLVFAERRMKISGKTNGWFFTGAGLGGMTLPWIIGQIFETVGPHSTMVTIMIDLLIALGILISIVYFYQPRFDLPPQ